MPITTARPTRCMNTTGPATRSTRGPANPETATKPTPPTIPAAPVWWPTTWTPQDPPCSTFPGDDGQHHEVGEPTLDIDGDGRADSAIVRHTDGSVTLYSDLNGDGHTEQVTQVDPSGSVLVAVTDEHGEWQLAATGHVDSDGRLVQDSAGTGAVDDTSDPGTGAQHLGMTLSADGADHDLGAPTADVAGAGTLDTVVDHRADGTLVAYTATEGTAGSTRSRRSARTAAWSSGPATAAAAGNRSPPGTSLQTAASSPTRRHPDRRAEPTNG